MKYTHEIIFDCGDCKYGKKRKFISLWKDGNYYIYRKLGYPTNGNIPDWCNLPNYEMTLPSQDSNVNIPIIPPIPLKNKE